MTAGDQPYCVSAGKNPLLSDSPAAWGRLIEAVGPASLLVVIDARMSDSLKHSTTPEDILQDALLHAWRDRARCAWRGQRSFRAWLLTIIDNRIRDAAAHAAALKRGGGRSPVPFSVLAGSGGDTSDSAAFPGPVASTTPSRVAMYSEQAAAIRDALTGLPPEVGEVVRLRLLEQFSMKETATRLGIGVEAVRHRFRKGAQEYRRRLLEAFTTQAHTISKRTVRCPPADSSPNK